jgi:Rieske 2Fe-2S family protein
MTELTLKRPKNLAPDQTWTEKFALSSEPISLEDTISPEFFKLETEAVFRRSWLYVGRAERVSVPGAFFTKEFETLTTSVLITRDNDGKVRAFHNVCPHRGNKLVWDTYAENEVSGRCRRFVCKFHGVAFGPGGSVEVLTDKVAWLDGQGARMQLADIPCELWNGFIFINLTPGGPKQTLREFIGEEYWSDFDVYPFDKMTQWYSFRSDANANWKALMDGFSEVYHAATTHTLPFAFPPLENVPVGISHMNDFAVRGKHRYYLARGVPENPFRFPYERETNAMAIGPRYKFPFPCEIPEVANAVGLENWGNSTNIFWPNLFIQFYAPGWYLTYRMMPLATDKMRFELDIYMPPPQNFSEALAQKSAITQFLEAALQDFSLLEAQQQGLKTRAFDKYWLTDQEVLVRQFHKQIQETVAEYQAEIAG